MDGADNIHLTFKQTMYNINFLIKKYIMDNLDNKI